MTFSPDLVSSPEEHDCDEVFPLVFASSSPGDAHQIRAWVADQTPELNRLLARHGAILFRNFGLENDNDVVKFIKEIEANIGAIEVAIYNIGGNIKFGITETTSQKYYKTWEMATFGAFLTGREVAKYMIKRKSGTIIFTGATASLRGGDGYSAFSGAKHAKRSLAQSMARELGPQGIHVAHVVIDGAIDTPWIKELFNDFYNEKKEEIKIGFRFIFQAKNTTLTSAEIDLVYNDIIDNSLNIKGITIPGI